MDSYGEMELRSYDVSMGTLEGRKWLRWVAVVDRRCIFGIRKGIVYFLVSHYENDWILGL